MNTTKIQTTKFINSFASKLEESIRNDDLDKAELSIKRALLNTIYDKYSKSLLYSYLGRIYFIKGRFDLSKKFLNSALKLNENNQDALFHMTNIYMSEQNASKALSYIDVNLSITPNRSSFLIQKTWCMILLEEYKAAKNIYNKLEGFRGIDPQGFVDIGMAYALRGNFEWARKTIFKALTSFPENMILESVLYELREIEESFSFYRKEFFFKNLKNIKHKKKIYASALRQVVEGMALRGYFQFEVEQASHLIIDLNSLNINVNSPGGLAAATEYLVSEFLGEGDIIRNVIVNHYSTSHGCLNNYLSLIHKKAFKNLENLNNNLMDYYELNAEEFFDESDDNGDDYE